MAKTKLGEYSAKRTFEAGVYSPDESDETWFHDRRKAQRRVREGLENGKLGRLCPK